MTSPITKKVKDEDEDPFADIMKKLKSAQSPDIQDNFALKSPITSQDNDGYWAMLRLNSDWTGYAQTMTALTPFIREVQNPTEVFA